MSPKQRIYITLEPGQIAWLRMLERTSGKSVSAQIRELVERRIEETLPTLEQVKAEQARREALLKEDNRGAKKKR